MLVTVVLNQSHMVVVIERLLVKTLAAKQLLNQRYEDQQAILRFIDEGNPICGVDETTDMLDSGLNRNPTPGQAIYDILAHYQVTSEWRHRELATELHRWAVIFNEEFQLEVSRIALRIDWLKHRTLGHFQPGHNGFGLKGEIAINERHLCSREPWEILGTVLHELLHAWQYEHGKPGKPPYHNQEFRKKALTYGLVIDEDGVTQYLSESAFKQLLGRTGIQMPEQPKPARRQRGTSKLKKWSCNCPVNVRVAINEFRARCLTCDSQFVQVELESSAPM
jgi:hypothetical protein